jgi:hypothetical protein
VLPLEKVLALALTKKWMPAFLSQAAAARSPQSPGAAAANDLGVTFLNVARESGLNAKTIFGGEHKNKYLLETTGCGVAFYDYDNDGWLDIFLVNGTRLEGFPASQEPTNHLFKNNRDGTFTDVTPKPAFSTPAGDRAYASAITTTTASTTSSSLISAEMFSTTTTATAPSPTSAKKPASPAPASAGTPAAPSSTMTATATSISSSRITLTSI